MAHVILSDDLGGGVAATSLQTLEGDRSEPKSQAIVLARLEGIRHVELDILEAMVFPDFWSFALFIRNLRDES